MLAYYAARDLILLYPLYPLFFADSGLALGQISSLFVIWSVASFLFEVPSGAWADTVDRRALLVVSGAIYAAAFSCWLLWPSYAGFASGFLLWGLSSAIMSGTFEAWLYDELTVQGRPERYATINGWCHAAAMAANLTGTLAAAPLYAWGGYALVGWTSVAVAGAHTALACSLPAAPRVGSADDSVEAAPRLRGTPSSSFAARYLAMLDAGLREVAGEKRVRRAVAVAACLVGLTVYDEYFPLVARDQGVAADEVALLIGLVVTGQLVGTALTGRAARLTSTVVAGFAAAAAVLIAVGALSGHAAGFVAIAIGYGLANNAFLVAEARLQDVISGPARATVTSVAGLSTEVVALGCYLALLAGSAWWSAATMTALLGLPMLSAAVLAGRWMPGPRETEVRDAINR